MTTNIMQYPEWEIEQGHEVKTKKKQGQQSFPKNLEYAPEFGIQN